MTVVEQPRNSYTVLVSWQNPSTLRWGSSGSLYSHPLRPCSILRPVCLFPVDQLHQRFLTVIDIAAVSARRNEAYGIGFQKLFTQLLIACRSDCNVFQKNLYVTDLDKLSSKHCTLAVRPCHHLGNTFPTRVCYRTQHLSFSEFRTRRKNLSSPIRSSH